MHYSDLVIFRSISLKDITCYTSPHSSQTYQDEQSNIILTVSNNNQRNVIAKTSGSIFYCIERTERVIFHFMTHVSSIFAKVLIPARRKRLDKTLLERALNDEQKVTCSSRVDWGCSTKNSWINI